MPIHMDAKEGEIAKVVLMPGDPLRAKYIAEKYMEDARLVNTIRGMYAYTGKYKGKEITVMGSGMGMASIGIYCYELYNFYNVETIIRIGTCGAFDESIEILDVLLVNGAYNEGNFAYNYNDVDCHWVEADKGINDIVVETSNVQNINCKLVNIASTECFDPYQPGRARGYLSRLPKDKNIVGTEMESFSLFYIANLFGKKASCILSVVDTNYENKNNEKIVSVEDRQNSLDDMILLALESSVKL